MSTVLRSRFLMRVRDTLLVIGRLLVVLILATLQVVQDPRQDPLLTNSHQCSFCFPTMSIADGNICCSELALPISLNAIYKNDTARYSTMSTVVRSRLLMTVGDTLQVIGRLLVIMRGRIIHATLQVVQDLPTLLRRTQILRTLRISSAKPEVT